ncbi:solute carrier 16 [Mactra antiquata]
MKRSAKNLDGGYGWVIVVAFFLIEVLVDGIRFSFGLYFVQFLDEFGEGKGRTAWVGSLMVATYNLGGPLFAAIVNKLGYRVASLIGSITASIGYIISYFATNVYFLYFTYGVIPGFGYGLLFLSGTVAVGRYFEEKRSLAIGISYCGSGVGSFMITPFVSYLIDVYTWRGSLLVLGGILLNCCVSSALYRPLDEDSGEGFEIENIEEVTIANGHSDSFHDVKQGIARNGEISHKPLTPLLPRTFAELRKEQLHAIDSNNQGSHRSLTWSHVSRRSLNKSIISQSILGSNASFGYMFDKRNQLKSSMSSLAVTKSFPKSDRTLAEESGNVFSNSIIEGMFPKALVLNINFIIMMISTLFIGVPSFVPISMLPDYARFTGSSLSQSAWLISTMGIGGTISRVVSGYLSDLKCVHRLTLLGACLLILAVATVIVAMVPVYEVLITYSSLYGVFFGALYVVQPIVLLEYFGADYIVEVMGIMMCVYGMSTIIGSPMAGWIFDRTNSYMTSFLVAGISFLVSGIINFCVLCTKPSRQARRQEKLERELNAIDVEVS